jgi:23S rRNA (guanosine2251-2'-O)-methyltransferase
VELDDLLAASEAPFVICLDQVTDPHNLGAIARVCDAAGATGLLIPDRRSATVTGAACKASAGALEHVAVAVCTNLADAIARATSAAAGNLWAYGAAADGDVAWCDVDWRGGILLVLGAEGSGIRPRVREACDQLVNLPMAGNVSSLNVATTAAIITYEALRQRVS